MGEYEVPDYEYMLEEEDHKEPDQNQTNKYLKLFTFAGSPTPVFIRQGSRTSY